MKSEFVFLRQDGRAEEAEGTVDLEETGFGRSPGRFDGLGVGEGMTEIFGVDFSLN
jgi:hypothetical protein